MTSANEIRTDTNNKRYITKETELIFCSLRHFGLGYRFKTIVVSKNKWHNEAYELIVPG